MNDNQALSSMLKSKTAREVERLRGLCSIDCMYDDIVTILTNRIEKDEGSRVDYMSLSSFFNIDENTASYQKVNNEVMVALAEKFKKNGFKAKITFSDNYYLSVSLRRPNLFTKVLDKLRARF